MEKKMKIPRNEHPQPQFRRDKWLSLNGEWEFEIDSGVSGIARELYAKEHLDGKITVPFCPESQLSGVCHCDFMNCVWYRRDFTVPEAWRNGRVILHFGAVDYEAHIYINGSEVLVHKGGYTSFSVDITEYLTDGKSADSLCVCAIDNDRNPLEGHGKQSREYHSHRCYYTRVTGIWQTVWLEYLPETHITSFRCMPDIENCCLNFEAQLCGAGELELLAEYEGKSVGQIRLNSSHGGYIRGTLPLSELHLWEPGHGRLYILTLTYGDDTVHSYFGMRSVCNDGMKFLLNGKPVFQRLVLDQGYYPDGIYTAPDEAALVNDIMLSMDAGFNGARLHQKVFEPLFLYHCDRLGYMVWGEYGNWGIDYSDIAALPPLLAEWTEAVNRDFNHPSLIGWCPLNETWDYEGRAQNNYLHSSLYNLTKSLDPTRPCIDTSGAYHVVTDVFDLHDYIQDPEEFASLYSLPEPEEIIAAFTARHVKSSLHQGKYLSGQPLFISEYGGIRWDADSRGGWGYGDAPATEEEFIERYRRLTDILLDNPLISGFCYTQLYDVEQEINGLYTYERKPKFDISVFRKINTRRAAIEEKE